MKKSLRSLTKLIEPGELGWQLWLGYQHRRALINRALVVALILLITSLMLIPVLPHSPPKGNQPQSCER